MRRSKVIDERMARGGDREVTDRVRAGPKSAPPERLQSEGSEMARRGSGNQAVRRLLEGGAASRGVGHPLDSTTRGRMESAFGADLSDVRVHTGPEGHRAASGLGARAFAIGQDIGFRSGEYRPGTPVGDAILAHELAHVLQQRGADRNASTTAAGSNPEHERDANRSAAGVLSRLWTAGTATLVAAGPRVRSGLALSRCTQTQEEQARAAFQAVLTGLASGRRQPFPIPLPDPRVAEGMLGVMYGVVREDFLMWQADGSHSPRYEQQFGTNYPDWAHYSQYGEGFGEIWPHFLRDAWANEIHRESQRGRSARSRGVQ